MNEFWQSIFGNLIADIILFGGGFLASRLYSKLTSKTPKIGKNLKASPDAKSFTSEVDGDIYLSNEKGTRNLTHSPSRETNAIWAGNSHWLAYGKQSNGKWQAIVHDTNTDKQVCLSEGLGDARPVEWNKDGDLIIGLGGSYLTIYNREIEKRLSHGR